MPRVDKNFLISHYQEIKKILTEKNVKIAMVHFDTNTAIYVDFESPDKGDFLDLKHALIDLCNKNCTAYTVYLCSLTLLGQKIDPPKDAILFDILNPSNNASLKPAAQNPADNKAAPPASVFKVVGDEKATPPSSYSPPAGIAESICVSGGSPLHQAMPPNTASTASADSTLATSSISSMNQNTK